MNITVGIGEYAISDNKDDVIKTFALGSCIAVAVYSPQKKVAGLAHIALPCSDLDIERSRSQPAHFVDTAVPFLLKKLKEEYGCMQNEVQVSVFGGAGTMQYKDIFRIGEKNIEAVKTILSEYNIMCFTEDTGGDSSRNLEFDVGTGTVKVNLFPTIGSSNSSKF